MTYTKGKGLRQSPEQVEDLIQQILRVTGVRREDFDNSSRQPRAVVLARHIFIYVMRVYWKALVREVAVALKSTDPSISRVLASIVKRRKYDRYVADTIDHVIAALDQSTPDPTGAAYADDLVDTVRHAYWLTLSDFQHSHKPTPTRARQVACYIMYFKQDIHPGTIAVPLNLSFRRIYSSAKEAGEKINNNDTEFTNEINAIEERMEKINAGVRPPILRFEAYDPKLDTIHQIVGRRGRDGLTGVKDYKKPKSLLSLTNEQRARISREPGAVPSIVNRAQAGHKFNTGTKTRSPWRNDGGAPDETLWIEHGDPECGHHWKIESPDGPTSTGRCKKCPAIKEHRNSPKRGQEVVVKAERAIGA